MKTILIIGGNGFVGYHVLSRLVKEGKKIRCINRSMPERDYRFDEIDYRIGDALDRCFLEEALFGVDTVLDFVSTTMPNTKEISLENEINSTLRYHNLILTTMMEAGVNNYVFPSSGGAIYGSRSDVPAIETDSLLPTTPYGVGKKMTEDMIHYFGEKCGLNAYILRIGNVYGSNRFRKRQQGVVDVFIQNALEDRPITIWGNASSAIRDYVHLDDVAEAVNMVVDFGFDGIKTYNIGTGIGTSLIEIVQIIEQLIGHNIRKEYKNDGASGVNRIILSNDKIRSEIGWSPVVTLEEGIHNTLRAKKDLQGY